MSTTNAIAHPAGPLVDGKRRCTACGLELPKPERWQEGDRVCIGPLLTPYSVEAGWDLDDDEIECRGSIDVGQRIDA